MNKLADTLKQGIMIELSGYHHYHTVAQRTDDKSAKNMFRQLAEDEARHGRILQNMLTEYERTCALSPGRLEGRPAVRATGDDPIFSPEFKLKVQEKHYELSALSVGILLEENSIKFYRQWAARARETKLKKLLKDLVSWEETHLSALMNQRRSLMENYWNQSRFSPF
ncbi:MAG: ferritin family protein, partial [Candidatus Edwardsbacteria bacterium]|nr:ferritin family protein [Candidatus Edwardsbacteria bacterium]